MPAGTEVLEAPARQILARGRKTLETILSKSGSAELKPLQTATNEVNFLMEAARLAIGALGVPANVADKDLHEARLRGLGRMGELRKLAEPCLVTGRVCSLLGVTGESV